MAIRFVVVQQQLITDNIIIIITSDFTVCENWGLQTGVVLSRKNSNFTFAARSLSPHDIFQFYSYLLVQVAN